MSRVEININPHILCWAREEAGFSPSEIAIKVDIDFEKYKLWEKEGKNIPLGKLKTIASAYKRQLAVFLLPAVPEKVTKPKDFRNLSPAESGLSREVLDVFRDVSYFRETALELQGGSYWKSRYEWLEKANRMVENAENFSQQLRDLLDISIDDQLSWKTTNEAYRKWRLAVEERLGILVFQFPMPMSEVQGFNISDNIPYAIVTNSNHTYAGRIFTIFHELAHIFRHQSGMCLYEQASENQKEEWECNLYAGNFLVPSNLIEKTDDLSEIASYSSKLHVSREAYLRRLKDENKISDLKFFTLLDQIKTNYKSKEKKKGFVKPEVRSKATRGETFFNMIVDAMYSNQISYNKASNALNLNISSLLYEI